MTGSPDRDPVGSSGAASGAGAPERGLFVIWPQAREDEREILADLADRFRIVGAYEIHWTPALVRRNYERFYSDLEVRGVYHEINKGAGPFLATIVIDGHPVHGLRDTSRGPRTVNTNFVDAKVEYRDRRGNLGIHCSETPAETRRDLTMLLGPDIGRLDDGAPVGHAPTEPWDGRVEQVALDVAGAHGWSSESELLTVLDASARYVALQAPRDGTPLFGGSARPELLTPDYHAVHTVMNADPTLGRPPPGGGRFTVDVGGSVVSVGIRTVGDGFIDASWARHCLEHRTRDERLVQRPPEVDDLATSCYLALARRPHLSDADRVRIRALAAGCRDGVRISSATVGRTEAIAVVDRHLTDRGYSWVVPRDPTVGHHVGLGRRERVIRAGRAAGYVVSHRVGALLSARRLAVRDAFVFRAPALRSVIRRWRGRP